MTDQHFSALVEKLERQAQSKPGFYQFKVFMLAMMGNVAVGIIFLSTLALLSGLLFSAAVFNSAFNAVFVFGLLLFMLLKAMWIKVDPPSGKEIDAEDAPELFAMIAGLRCRLNAPRIHRVLITDDFNAGMVQLPRFGVAGWTRNVLLIGLPLMKSLSTMQFKAVLAHELGHLAHGHGRISNWIFRQRSRWSRLLSGLDADRSKTGFLIKPFLNLFVPYFNAYSFPMARANEYEADAVSVRLTSADAVAEALTGVSIMSSYLAEHYWPQIHKRVEDQPQPGCAPYLGMGQNLATGLDDTSVRTWLDQAMTRSTDTADTHPSLPDRLRAIGRSPRLVLPSVTADRLLGAALHSVTEKFDRQWLETILPSWKERHHQVQADRRHLCELDAILASGAELTLQQAYDRARLTETVGGNADDALMQFHALYRRVPDDAFVCLCLGSRLLNRDDASGCALIEHAMQVDEETILEGCRLLRDYCWRNRKKEEARAWNRRLLERANVVEAASRERSRVLHGDRFDRHGLSDSAVGELHLHLRNIPGVRKAYLVRKRVKHLPHLPCYILGFRVAGLFQLHSKRRAEKVFQQINDSIKFPGHTLIVNTDGVNSPLGRKFCRMRGARLL